MLSYLNRPTRAPRLPGVLGQRVLRPSPDSIPPRQARARTRTSRRKNRPATSANASSSPARSRDPSISSTLASAAALGSSVPTHLKHPSGGRLAPGHGSPW